MPVRQQTDRIQMSQTEASVYNTARYLAIRKTYTVKWPIVKKNKENSTHVTHLVQRHHTQAKQNFTLYITPNEHFDNYCLYLDARDQNFRKSKSIYKRWQLIEKKQNEVKSIQEIRAMHEGNQFSNWFRNFITPN